VPRASPAERCLAGKGGGAMEFGDDPPAPISFSELKKDFLLSLFEEKQELIRV
jgi:hypothetical protein